MYRYLDLKFLGNETTKCLAVPNSIGSVTPHQLLILVVGTIGSIRFANCIRVNVIIYPFRLQMIQFSENDSSIQSNGPLQWRYFATLSR